MNAVDHDALAEDVSQAGDELMEVLAAVRSEQRAAVLRRAADLRAAEAKLAAAETRLRDACLARPSAFAKPRTRLVAGIRFGLRKLPDNLVFDADETAALAREHDMKVFAERLDRKALANLHAAERKLLGVRLKKGKDGAVLERVRDALDDLRPGVAADLA